MNVYLVCYDISDDGLRDEVSRILGEHGNRVQRSVFEVAVRSESDAEALRARLREALGDAPELRVYRLCERCRGECFALTGERLAAFPTTIIV